MPISSHSAFSRIFTFIQSLYLDARSSAAIAMDSGVRKLAVVLTNSLANVTEELTAFADSTCLSKSSDSTSSKQATNAMLSGPVTSRASSFVCVPFMRMSVCRRGSIPSKKRSTDITSLCTTRTAPPLRSATAPPTAAPACCQSGSSPALPSPTSTIREASPPKGFATSTEPALPANFVWAMNSSNCPNSARSTALPAGKSTSASFESASSGWARANTT
mmetsp:Transcript_16190/g.37217  ORF Transcript_16190/g.37217 Transcript_16190/m.37217 type:complete len:219 (-) Transcript_16190:393-1049(-)